MSKIVRCIGLSIPLLWFINLWMSFIFGMNIQPEYSIGLSDGLAGLLALGWLFIGTPACLILGLIYTAKRNYWRWFTAYMILGVGFVVALYGLKYYWSLQN